MPAKNTTRRQWLTQSAVSLSAGAGFALYSAHLAMPATAAENLSPEESLRQLYVGNKRFVEGKGLAPNRDLAHLRQVAPRQTPSAAFLGCADSRVPIEIVFDQGFGDLFVTRIAGNVALTENIASLEFATQVLGAKVVYVLGHTSCGAVTAATKGEPVPGQISALFQHIRPAVRAAKGDVPLAVRENVRVQAQTLLEASTVIAALVAQKKVVVAGGIFDLNSGAVEALPLDA